MPNIPIKWVGAAVGGVVLLLAFLWVRGLQSDLEAAEAQNARYCAIVAEMRPEPRDGEQLKPLDCRDGEAQLRHLAGTLDRYRALSARVAAKIERWNANWKADRETLATAQKAALGARNEARRAVTALEAASRQPRAQCAYSDELQRRWK